ncbi:TetR family transcriptional regulator C-terminal domain-containing protein [Microbispora siamensis]
MLGQRQHEGLQRALRHRVRDRLGERDPGHSRGDRHDPPAVGNARQRPRAAVERLLLEAAEVYTDPAHPPGCMIISAGVNTSDPAVIEELRGHREAGKAAIRRRIERDVEAGLLPPQTDAPALATFFAAVIQGMSTQARDGATRADLDAVATLALRAWP